MQSKTYSLLDLLLKNKGFINLTSAPPKCRPLFKRIKIKEIILFQFNMIKKVRDTLQVYVTNNNSSTWKVYLFFKKNSP